MPATQVPWVKERFEAMERQDQARAILAVETERARREEEEGPEVDLGAFRREDEEDGAFVVDVAITEVGE